MVGKVKIELTNTKTRNKKVIEKKNIVTNAIADALSFRLGDIVCPLGNFMPLPDKGLGGILLFPEPLVEEASNTFAPKSNEPTGYAGANVNPGTDVKRGSRNMVESLPVVGGYQFVWDFASSQANGQISAVALTHAKAGECYFSSPLNRQNSYTQIADMPSEMPYPNPVFAMVEVDFISSVYYSIFFDTSTGVNNLVATKTYLPISKVVGVNTTTHGKILEKHVLATSKFTSTLGRFFDGGDGFWYGVSYSSNSSGNALVDWIKISKADYTTTEGTWVLNETFLSSSGNTYANNTTPSGTVAFLDGKLYMLNQQRNGIYIMDWNDPSSIDYVSCPQVLSNINSNYLIEYSGYIIGRNIRLNPETKEIIYTDVSYSDNLMGYPSRTFVHKGVALTAYSSSGGVRSMLITPYLGTICSLDEPVTKTPSDTMKITYTLLDS